MATLLEGVATADLEAKYNASLDFVLDGSTDKSNKETLIEEEQGAGDRVDLSREDSILSESRKARLRTLMGKN